MQTLTGSILISRRLAGHKVWHREPFCAGAAWLDLLLLANTAPADVHLHGEPVHLERGQLAWAIQTLAERWRRSREWATKFLNDLAGDGMIAMEKNTRKTVITICNYDAFQAQVGLPTAPSGAPYVPTAEPAAAPATVPTAVPATAPAQRLEIGVGVRSLEGEGRPPTTPEIPADEVIQKFCSEFRDMARGIEHGIPEGWWRDLVSFWLARNTWPVLWQRALVSKFVADWMNSASPGYAKARAGVSGARGQVSGNGQGAPHRERGEVLQALALAREKNDAPEIEILEKELGAGGTGH